jgi:hypothetical protein
VERAARNPRLDVDDAGVLLSELGVPPTGHEIDSLHDRRIEQFVETSRHAGRDRHAIHEIRVLCVLVANVHLPRGRPGGSGQRLLDDLRGRLRRREVGSVLGERLVPGPRVHGDRCPVDDRNRLQLCDRHREAEVRLRCLSVLDGDLPPRRLETEHTGRERVSASRQAVQAVPAERIGHSQRNDRRTP